MMLSLIKFFHIICGISFFGIVIAEFYYIISSINKNDQSLIDYSIRASYFGDAVILLCVFIQTATSTTLVSVGHFTLAVPWIFIACLAYGFLIVLWLFKLFIKKFYLSKKNIASYSIKLFYLLNIAMILIFMIIIHDAVNHSTWFEFLLRK